MKRLLLCGALVLVVTVLLSSCASQRYKGCPATNKRYFTG